MYIKGHNFNKMISNHRKVHINNKLTIIFHKIEKENKTYIRLLQYIEKSIFTYYATLYRIGQREIKIYIPDLHLV